MFNANQSRYHALPEHAKTFAASLDPCPRVASLRSNQQLAFYATPPSSNSHSLNPDFKRPHHVSHSRTNHSEAAGITRNPALRAVHPPVAWHMVSSIIAVTTSLNGNPADRKTSPEKGWAKRPEQLSNVAAMLFCCHSYAESRKSFP